MIFILWLIILFVLAFLARRRFGLVGLGLTTGATLATLWTEQVTMLIAKNGVQLAAPPLASVVGVALTLLPSMVLFFSGPKQKDMIQRVIAAAAYAVLATTFLLVPLGNALVLTGFDKTAYDFLLEYRVYIVTAGIVYALVDIVFRAKGGAEGEKSKH